jgi:hypothetical protein
MQVMMNAIHDDELAEDLIMLRAECVYAFPSLLIDFQEVINHLLKSPATVAE